MFVRFSEEVRHILKMAKAEMQALSHPFVGSEHLILSILKYDNTITIKLKDYHINYDIYKKELIKTIGIGKSKNDYFIYTPLLKRVLEEAIIDTKESNLKEVSLNTLFLSILDEGEGVGIRLLNKLGIDIDKLYDELSSRDTSKVLSKKLYINECGIDLCKKAKENEFDPLIGRDKEVNTLIEIICRRNKSNPLLIGEAGVGKTAIVEELAKRIVNGKVPEKIKNSRIYSLSMASCVSGTKYRGEFEERITKIVKELENNPDIILFIDEIHTLVGAGGAEGAIDASNILKPALARGNIKVIGATTINEYKDTISKDKALNRRFQTITINENTDNETKNILYNLKDIYEKYHHVIISDVVIDKIIELSNKYIFDKKNPDKAIDILDTVCTKVSIKENKDIIKINKLKEELDILKKEKNNLIIKHHFNEATIIRNKEIIIESNLNSISLKNKKQRKRKITISDVATVIEDKTNIPIYEVHDNIKKIAGLNKYLKNIIIGQDNIIDSLTDISKKIVLGLKSNLPYSFLFVGKSGVGKTMLVKEFSNYMKIPLIRLDMSLYKESYSISKIIGSSPGYVGYNEYNSLLDKVRNNPYSIILLDEIEKAHSEVINVFLSILDEGVIVDNHGEKVDFRNTIIIMTSNIGSDRDNIGFNSPNNKEEDIRNILSTIFVNRINKVCYFNNLNEKNIVNIIKRKIDYIKKKYSMYDIKITINDKIIKDIIKESDYIIYGARKLNKILEDKIDNIVINSILKKDKKVVINNL